MRGAPRVGFTRGGLILTVAIDPLSGQKLGTTKSKAPPSKSVKDGAPKFTILTRSGRTGVVLERGADSTLRNAEGRATRRLLSEYVDYYHEDRTHLGLGKGTPNSRIPSTALGRVASRERLGGLHHRYGRAA